MLPKPNRLTKKNDFDAVFSKGVSAKSGFLVCKILKHSSLVGGAVSRFGFVVSKKISHKATTRNKVRRWLQNSVAIYFLHIKSPIDAVLVTLPGIEKGEFFEVNKMVEDVFKKLKLI